MYFWWVLAEVTECREIMSESRKLSIFVALCRFKMISETQGRACVLYSFSRWLLLGQDGKDAASNRCLT
jgi:hypothetical protein